MDTATGEEHVVSDTFIASLKQLAIFTLRICWCTSNTIRQLHTLRLPAVHLDKSGKSALDGGLCFLLTSVICLYLTGFAPTGLQRIVGNFRYHLGVGVYRGFAYYLRTATSCTYYTHILSRLKINISFYPLF